MLQRTTSNTVTAAQERTRHVYDYLVVLERDESIRSMNSACSRSGPESTRYEQIVEAIIPQCWPYGRGPWRRSLVVSVLYTLYNIYVQRSSGTGTFTV